MPRNFFRRIEATFPIEDGNLRERISGELLALALTDNVKARVLHPDGVYRRARPAEKEPPRRSQSEFIELAQRGELAQAPKPAKKAKHPTVKLRPRPAR